MLINKIDIQQFTQFTQNIEDRIFNHNILDGQEFDLKPVIGNKMFDALILAAPNGYSNWNALTAYAVNDLIVDGSSVYIAINPNTGNQPSLNPADWSVNELGTFFLNFLKPFLVFVSYGNFLLWAGTNLTQYGIVQIDEDTSEQITDQRRAELIANVKKKSNIWLSRLKRQMCEVNETFDSVNYSQTDGDFKANPRKTFNIRPVGVPNIINNLPNNQKPMNQTEQDFYGY